jgi:hypothetical protein
MPLIASDIISDALAYAFPYIPEFAIAPGAQLRFLTALENEVLTWYAMTAPERVSVAGTPIVISITSNASGYALTSGQSYTDFRYVDNQGIVWAQPIRIVPENKFFDPQQHPAGIVRSVNGVNTFFPCDPAEVNWSQTGPTIGPRFFFVGNGDQIFYRYVPSTVLVATTTQQLLSPDEARQFLGWSLALQTLLAAEGVPPEKLQTVIATAAMQKQMLLQLATKRTGTLATFQG